MLREAGIEIRREDSFLRMPIGEVGDDEYDSQLGYTMSNCKKLQQYLAQNPEKAQGLEWPERPNPENVPPVTPDPVEPSQEMIEAQKRVDHQDDQCPEGTTRHPEDKRKSDGSLICLTAAQLDRYNSRHAAAAEVEPDTITQGIFDEPAVPAEKQPETISC